MDSELRDLINVKSTAPLTVAATMRNVLDHYRSIGTVPSELERAVDELEMWSGRPVAVRRTLVEDEVSPQELMALLVNTLIRVLPTYAEIPRRSHTAPAAPPSGARRSRRRRPSGCAHTRSRSATTVRLICGSNLTTRAGWFALPRRRP